MFLFRHNLINWGWNLRVFISRMSQQYLTCKTNHADAWRKRASPPLPSPPPSSSPSVAAMLRPAATLLSVKSAVNQNLRLKNLEWPSHKHFFNPPDHVLHCWRPDWTQKSKMPKCQNKQELKLVALQTEDTKSLMMFCQLFQEHFVP